MSIDFHTLEQGFIEAVAAPFVTPSAERVAVTAIWPVRCYLIRHRAGDLLWDTGLPEEALHNDPSALGGMRKHISNRIDPWLHQFGLSTASVPMVGLSHMHIDHGGNVNQFTSARFLVADTEFRYATSAGASGPYYPPGYSNLTYEKVQPVSGLLDVFGDGIVVIRPASGHSPGHQVLHLSIPERQPIVLMGDACYSSDDLIHRKAPTWNHDLPMTFRTLDDLVELTEATGSRMLIHHDPDARI